MKALNVITAIALVMSLCACSSVQEKIKTKETVLHKGSKTITCGGGYAGFVLGGGVGKAIEESHDANCVDDAHSKGYY